MNEKVGLNRTCPEENILTVSPVTVDDSSLSKVMSGYHNHTTGTLSSVSISLFSPILVELILYAYAGKRNALGEVSLVDLHDL